MTATDITTGIQTVTSSGAVPGVLATANLSGPFCIKLQVVGLATTYVLPPLARIVIQDTASASQFSDAQPVMVVDVPGPVNVDVTYGVRDDQVPATRIGDTNSALRVYVYFVSVDTTLQVHAWLEQ